jgi:hypothetical protein
MRTSKALLVAAACDADQQGIAGRGGLCKPILLAMQRVGGEQHAGHAKLGHQPRHRRDLVRSPSQLLVGQDQGGVTGEGAEHVNCFAVVQVVKATAQCLTIEGDRPQRTRRLSCVQRAGMVAEGGFEIVTAERQEQVAQSVHGRGAPEAGAEDGIQALALEGDKGDDLLVGGRACECGEDREQQQITHAVALALRPARIGHFGECGKQGSKWHRGDLYKGGRSPL